MKETFYILIDVILCVSLIGCQNTLKGADALIEKVREKIPVSEADSVVIQYAGICANDDSALMWFISVCVLQFFNS